MDFLGERRTLGRREVRDAIEIQREADIHYAGKITSHMAERRLIEAC